MSAQYKRLIAGFAYTLICGALVLLFAPQGSYMIWMTGYIVGFWARAISGNPFVPREEAQR